ncbi:MAG: protein translocase subunit SecD [Nitrospinae bacterium]|nr:protein translocase subunit SecD [Nitrospinota bacterium]
MLKSLRWKIPLIVAVVSGSTWLAYPLNEKIALGLDLQGGMHLVLEVQADKAVEASLERIADDIKRAIQDEDIEVESVSAHLEGSRVRVTLADAVDAAQVDKILKGYPYLKKGEVAESGAELTFNLDKSEVQRIEENAVHQGLETIRNRVDQFGVTEPTIQVQGKRRILVQLPGVKDPERAVNLIGKTARLEFKLVDDQRSVQDALAGNLPEGDEILHQRQVDKETGESSKQPFLLKRRTILTGETLTNAEVRFDSEFGQPYVAIAFNSVGAMVFHQTTKENVGKRLAIILDNNVYSAPVIQDEIAGGRAQITGHFTTDEAHDLAIVLRAGALPAPVVILENRTVGPSLGRDSIEKGVFSAIIACVLLFSFIIVYYRLSGLVAVLALVLNVILLMGSLAYFKASLTLPGIAGIILTVGMAIDANVLIYERIREELRIGKTVRAAVEAGYDKAFTTILDSNITTLIAAVVLFQFGTGPIKGFAITLCIGLVASMFTAVFACRVIFDLALGRKKLDRLSI